MEQEFLPIGTVVLLKGGQKKLMIAGYLPITQDGTGRIYDYSGCIFPEGILSSDKAAAFNHDQIQEVISKGYSNEETTDFFKNTLTKVINNIKNKANANANMNSNTKQVVEELKETPIPSGTANVNLNNNTSINNVVNTGEEQPTTTPVVETKEVPPVPKDTTSFYSTTSDDSSDIRPFMS